MKYDVQTIQMINDSLNVVDYAKKYLNLIENNGKYWACCPFHLHDDTPSLSFDQEKNVFYCFGCGKGGSTIKFLMEYHNISFKQATDAIIKHNGLTIQHREYSDVLNYLNIINRENKNISNTKREYLSESVLDQYEKSPIWEWTAEGLEQDIMEKYDVRLDKKGNRIVYPVRDINGKIIAIKGRTLENNYKDLKIPKYIYYQPIYTNDFIFGLDKNIKEIQRKKEIILFEGMKSVILAEGYGYFNCGSLETNRINYHQLKVILSLKTDVTMALDKGIEVVAKPDTYKTKENEVNVGILAKMTNVYVIQDNNNLLDNKNAPVDKGKDIWDKLYNERKLIE